jgi:hypothetical protein
VLFNGEHIDAEIVDCDRPEIRAWQSYSERARCDTQRAISNCAYRSEHVIYTLTAPLKDVNRYGFRGLNNISSSYPTSNGITLAPPTLNIDAFYLPDDNARTLGSYWMDPRTGLMPFRDKSRTMWEYQNATYDFDLITRAIGACQPLNVRVSTDSIPPN